MRTKILKFILLFQGLYYSLTGLWAIVSLESFSRVTNHYGDAFEMHSIAALALVLGLFLVWSAFNEALLKPAGFLALGAAIAIIIPEFIYLPKNGSPTLFWADFIEESLVALLLILILFRRKS